MVFPYTLDVGLGKLYTVDNEKSGLDKEGQTYETLWNAKARDR